MALTGSVQDAVNNAALSNVMVQIANGPDVEKFTITDSSGTFALREIRPGAFVVRFTREGFETLDRTVSASQDTRIDVQLKRGPECPPLPAPAEFRVNVAGTTVTYLWNGVDGAVDYLLGVGPSSGSSRNRSTNTTDLSYVWRGMPPGNYYARVVARSACGRSNASREAQFTVGTPSS